MKIAFFEAKPNIVAYKIAKALKNRGHETILISFLKFDKQLFENAYSKMICFDIDSFSMNKKSAISLMKKSISISRNIINIKKTKFDIAVGISAPQPIWLIALVKFFTKKPFIYFPYDVNILKYKNRLDYKKAEIPEFELKAEKYLFENSQAILFKGNEYNFVKNIFNIKDYISFPPYCSDDFIIPINKEKLSKKDKEIHLVYIGNVELAEDGKNLGLGSWEKTIQGFIKDKTHIHIYSSRYNEIINSKSLKKFISNKYCHFHKPLNEFNIIPEISKYDFALFFCHTNFDIFKRDFASSTGANKLATYLEAGIPFIIHDDLLTPRNLMNKYGLDIHINREKNSEIKNLINKLNYSSLIKKIEKARKDFNLSSKIPILEEFFKKIINS